MLADVEETEVVAEVETAAAEPAGQKRPKLRINLDKDSEEYQRLKRISKELGLHPRDFALALIKHAPVGTTIDALVREKADKAKQAAEALRERAAQLAAEEDSAAE